jgi:hypothetical protein
MTGRKLYSDVEQDDEIDLMLLLTNAIHFLKKNSKVFILFLLLGLIIGSLSFYLLPRVYKVNMLADSRILNGEEVIAIVDSWQDLLKKGEYNLLSRKFNISVKEVESIKTIEAETNKRIARDQERNAFLIKLEVFDNSSLDSLQSGIIYALKNSDYIRRRIETQRENLELLKSKINNEIAELDSIKLSMHKLLRTGGNSANPFLTDPSSVNLHIVSLYEKQLKIAEEIKFLEEIQVIEGFTRVEKADKPKLIICLLSGIFIGLVSAIIYILIQAIRGNLKRLHA